MKTFKEYTNKAKGDKYELTDETIKVAGKTLYRIKALKSFGKVKSGELGGYIESEKNLSHKGNAWVSDKAAVYGKAKVYDNAWVFEGSQVHENAKVYGNAQVYYNTRVYGNTELE